VSAVDHIRIICNAFSSIPSRKKYISLDISSACRLLLRYPGVLQDRSQSFTFAKSSCFPGCLSLDLDNGHQVCAQTMLFSDNLVCAVYSVAFDWQISWHDL
jgi:hypothetical protein